MSDGQAVLLSIACTAIGIGASHGSTANRATISTPRCGPLQAILRSSSEQLTPVGLMLKQAGLGHPTYDGEGNITGLVITATGFRQ